MSILAEFFVGTEDAAAQYDRRDWPAEDVFSTGGLLPMHLELLWAIVQGRDWDVDVMDDFTQLGEATDERWLVKLPDELVRRVASASLAELRQIQVKWAETEEMSARPEDLNGVMGGLQALSRRAMASGRSVYLWGAL